MADPFDRISASGEEKLRVASGRPARDLTDITDPARKDLGVRQNKHVIYQRLSVIPFARRGELHQPSEISQLKPPKSSAKLGGICWFALAFALPVLVASIYYGLIASNQYVASFKFTVTEASSSALGPGTNPLLSLLGGAVSGGSNNNFMVVDYLTSRQAAEELQKRISVEDLYSKPDIDWLGRFNRSEPMEAFVRYWQSRITARFDMVTGIASAEVRAYSPEDALLIANTLVQLAEELVNRIAMRTKQDAVRLARSELEQAQNQLRATRDKMTAYREKFGLIDPSSSVVASNSTLIQSLRANLAQLETQLTTLLAQKLNADAPAIITLKNQIRSTKEQLVRTESSVGRTDETAPLSTVVADYERLNLDVQLAQNLVTSAMQAYEQARASASAQQLYITPYVRPSMPESSTYPDRLLSILFVAFVACAAWIVGKLIGRSVSERFS
jgi:capsular polysaccharide transport system permease protein